MDISTQTNRSCPVELARLFRKSIPLELHAVGIGRPNRVCPLRNTGDRKIQLPPFIPIAFMSGGNEVAVAEDWFVLANGLLDENS